MSFPWINLNIEVTDHCNLRCWMCAQYEGIHSVHGVGHPKKFMDVKTVEKIMRQLNECGQKVKCISPFWFGEPLMHPHFLDIWDIITGTNRKREPFEDITINTNAVFLTPVLSDHILAYAQDNIERGFSHRGVFILLSMDFVSSEVFERVKGGSAELSKKILENIEYLLEQRRNKKICSPNLLFQFVIQNGNQHEARGFLEYWSNKLDYYGASYDVVDSPKFFRDRDSLCLTRLLGERISIQRGGVELHGKTLKEMGFYASEYAENNEIVLTSAPYLRKPCNQIWHQLIITSQGVIVPCCRDQMLQLALGNIEDNSLCEVLKGERLKELRLLHAQGRQESLPICKDCYDPPGGHVNDQDVIDYLSSMSSQAELKQYVDRMNDERRQIVHTGTALQEVDYQLKIYNFSIQKDDSASFLEAKKVGGLEFQHSAILEVSYSFVANSQWILLDYPVKRKDWSDFKQVNIWLKGDGLGGDFEIIVREEDGDRWYCFLRGAFLTSDWKLFNFGFDRFELPEWALKGDCLRTFKRVEGYSLLFERHDSAVGKIKKVSIGNMFLS